MLPGESQFQAEIADKLSFDLTLGNALLQTLISILTERQPFSSPEQHEQMAFSVGKALCVKACKSYRSILLLSEIGASHDAQILGRTIFETAIAAHFVLLTQVAFGLKEFSDDELTSEFRAQVYAAFRPIRRYRNFLNHKGDARFSAILGCVDGKRLEKAAADAATQIGPFWSARLNRRPYTYSGFNLRELAETLDRDLSRWYAAVYGDQSKPVHAVDAVEHVQLNEAGQRISPKWQGSFWDVQDVLLTSGLLTCKCMVELNNRFHFLKNPHDDIETSRELELAILALGQIEKYRRRATDASHSNP